MRPHRRLVLVVTAPGDAPDAVLAALGRLGVGQPPVQSRLMLDALVAGCDKGETGTGPGRRASGGTRGGGHVTSGPCRTALERDGLPGEAAATLRTMAEQEGPTSPSLTVAWHHRELAGCLAQWMEPAAAADWELTVLVAWERPDKCIARTRADAPAEVLAEWETTYRDALSQLKGRPCIVAEVDRSAPDAVIALADRLAPWVDMTSSTPMSSYHESCDWPDRDADGSRISERKEMCSEVLDSQWRLADTLAHLDGYHEALVVPPLGAPSSWVQTLVLARQRARCAATDTVQAWEHAATTAEDADALWRALWQVSTELVDVVSEGLGGGDGEPYGADASGEPEAYRQWLNERAEPSGPAGSAELVDPRLAGGPLVSVVVPVYKPDFVMLELAVASVLRQTYGRFELCLCDDGSDDPTVTAALADLASGDPRVKVTGLAKNGGISAATNGALGLATGQWVAFMDQDDELLPDALAEVIGAVIADPTVDLVYTDDDKIDFEGRPFSPQFKPDWNPDLLLSICYFSHLVAMRRSIVDEVGGLRSAFDGSQDWDLALRVSERCRTIHHIPKVLYHWRAVASSAALDNTAKPWAHEAGRRAATDALSRRGEPGTVEHHPDFIGLYQVRRQLTCEPLVSIVVPFRDGAALLQRCVDSLMIDPGYHRFELVLVDNGSTEPELLALLDRLSADHRVSILTDARPFNWAALNNAAISRSRGDMVLLLNNDVTAKSGGWLRELLVHGQRPDIGAVGARLLYPDGRLQHVGVVIGMRGIAGNPMERLPGDSAGYMGFAAASRNWSAVTGACLLARRSVIEEVGGFDEGLAAAFGDVDFCLRVVDHGYRIVTTPLAEMVHAASSTCGVTGFTSDVAHFLNRWESRVHGDDPMFSPNLSRLDARCVVRPADEDDRWNELLKTLTPS